MSPASTDLTAELAAERRSAARLLLRHPLVTRRSHPEEFALVRRHADDLGRLFTQQFGYRLVVEPGFARLHKAGLGEASGHRLERTSGMPFTPRTYACLALVLSVLVTAPEQMLLSELITGMRMAAADAGVDLSDTTPAATKRTVTAVLTTLVAWQVLTENEGSVESYATDESAEALLTIDRELSRQMVSGPVGRVSGPAELVTTAASPGPGGARHFVRRRLVETPVVYLDDLTAAERAWLRQQQRREQRILEDLLGLETEIRAEGAAVVDPDGELSDLDFPAGGRTVIHAALCLVRRLTERLRPHGAGHPAAGGRLVIGVPVPDGMVEAELAELAERHQQLWARRYVESPEALRAAVLDVLCRMRLIAPAGPTRADADRDPEGTGRQVTDVRGGRGAATHGWVLLAAAARYRQDPAPAESDR
jgi:uncharacterized protein (TIGR02678 family)